MKPIFAPLDKYKSKTEDVMEISTGSLSGTEYWIDGSAIIILDLIQAINNLTRRLERLEKENANKK